MVIERYVSCSTAKQEENENNIYIDKEYDSKQEEQEIAK